MNWKAACILIRPANIVTAVADVLAGFAIAGIFSSSSFPFDGFLLILSTIGLYGGGIVFNDVMDYEKDKINRPERILPSQKLSVQQAIGIGIFLFVMAIISAFAVSVESGFLACLIVVLALTYNKWSKHFQILGPLNMGMCRGANLMLGVSILPALLPKVYLLSLIPVLFVAAITLTAQKEASGKNKLSIGIAMFLDFLVVLGFFVMSHQLGMSLQRASIFLLLWYGINVIFKYRAIVNNDPAHIQQAVKMSVLSIIPLDASFTAGFGTVFMAILVLGLLPVSILLSKKFAVT